MGKAKMQKLREVSLFPNVFENRDFRNPSISNYEGEKVELKGKWSELVFDNKNPITLELACGKGDYTLKLAEKFNDRNFIGVDIKGDRLWRAAKTSNEKSLTNTAFLRTKIEQLSYFFEPGEVSEIWITFPDPCPKKPDTKRRLLSPNFLDLYKSLLHKGSVVHIKTDAIDLFEYSIESIRSNNFEIKTIQRDIYSKPLENDLLSIKTYYELMHIRDGRTINYLSFII